MTSEFDMSTINIPYGVLHDSCLKSVTYENNKMTFSFDVNIYPEDYTDNFYKQYKDFKHCNMTVEMVKEPWNYFVFETCMNNRGKIKGLSINREAFLDAVNSAVRVTFVECAVSDNEFKIELSVNFWHAKGKRKYRKYDMCYISLDATKVIWEWY